MEHCKFFVPLIFTKILNQKFGKKNAAIVTEMLLGICFMFARVLAIIQRIRVKFRLILKFNFAKNGLETGYYSYDIFWKKMHW